MENTMTTALLSLTDSVKPVVTLVSADSGSKMIRKVYVALLKQVSDSVAETFWKKSKNCKGVLDVLNLIPKWAHVSVNGKLVI
jgi:hypothetical protein